MNIPRPEGFIVNEITGDYSTGECTHFTLKKTGYNTLSAIKLIANQLNVSVERFGYAGLKDRNAITTQRVSAWRVPVNRLKKINLKNIELSDFKERLERIKLGTHKGNKFIITLKGFKLSDLRKPVNITNLFGNQRFNGNELLGKALIERDWNKIIELMKNNPNGSYEKIVLREYDRHGNAIRAIKKVNKRIRVLWVNAWQAYQWNKSINLKIKEQSLKSYEMIPEMPELGCFPGGYRKTIMKVKDYKISTNGNDVKLEFTLEKGSYATTLINFITSKSQRIKKS